MQLEAVLTGDQDRSKFRKLLESTNNISSLDSPRLYLVFSDKSTDAHVTTRVGAPRQSVRACFWYEEHVFGHVSFCTYEGLGMVETKVTK
jgi:hypothetical protein